LKEIGEEGKGEIFPGMGRGRDGRKRVVIWNGEIIWSGDLRDKNKK
jgi:hypothetical protein